MREVEEGNLNVQLDNRRIDEMGQLSGRFNRMAQRLRQNLKDSLRQQRELNEAQIRMMQAQLNPHFLYNTLDTIKWMGKIHQAPEIATISADLATSCAAASPPMSWSLCGRSCALWSGTWRSRTSAFPARSP